MTSEKTESLPVNPASPEFSAMAKKRYEEIAQVQSDLLDEIREAGQSLFDRIQTEANLASDFTSRLASSHSISETSDACQEWAKRRMDLLTEDNKRLMTDSQKFMKRAAHLLSNGWLSNGRIGGGT